jgi:hypothetical protein
MEQMLIAPLPFELVRVEMERRIRGKCDGGLEADEAETRRAQAN